MVHGLLAISILVPCLGSDKQSLLKGFNPYEFQFSLPAWGARVLAGLLVVLLVISILASAWGAMCIACRIVLLSYVFNSRSPYGE